MVSLIMILCAYDVQGAIVYSNIVTTVSPTYAQEVRSEVLFLFTFGSSVNAHWMQLTY
jgi:glycogen synthase